MATLKMTARSIELPQWLAEGLTRSNLAQDAKVSQSVAVPHLNHTPEPRSIETRHVSKLLSTDTSNILKGNSTAPPIAHFDAIPRIDTAARGVKVGGNDVRFRCKITLMIVHTKH